MTMSSCLIYNRSPAGEFDALHQHFLVYLLFDIHEAIRKKYCSSTVQSQDI